MHTEDQITDLDVLELRAPRYNPKRLTIADAARPADGRYDFRRLQAIALHKKWHLEVLDWTVEDDDGQEHDVEVVVLLCDYVRARPDSWDEPGNPEYFESARVFVQETPVCDELGCPPATSEYFVELDDGQVYDEINAAAQAQLLDSLR